WSGTYTDLANRTGSVYGSGSGNGFRHAPPLNRISATQNTYVRAWVNYHGQTDWLTTGMNLGRCDQWFDMSAAVATSDNVLAPGESTTLTYTLCNDDDERNMIPPAARGVAPGVNVRTVSSQVSGTQTLTLNSALNTTRDFGPSGSSRCLTATRTGEIG